MDYDIARQRPFPRFGRRFREWIERTQKEIPLRSAQRPDSDDDEEGGVGGLALRWVVKDGRPTSVTLGHGAQTAAEHDDGVDIAGGGGGAVIEPQAQGELATQESLEIRPFRPATPTTPRRRLGRVESAVNVDLANQRDTIQGDLVQENELVVDDKPFAEAFDVMRPRPREAQGLRARPRWLQREEARLASRSQGLTAPGPLPQGSSDLDIGIAADTGADDDLSDIAYDLTDWPSADVRSAMALLEGDNDAVLAGSQPEQAPSEDLEEPPATKRARREAARRAIEDAAEQRRRERPFELEADLTEESLVVAGRRQDGQVASNGSSSAPPQAPATSAPQRISCVQANMQTVDFAALTAITTPGSETLRAVSSGTTGHPPTAPSGALRARGSDRTVAVGDARPSASMVESVVSSAPSIATRTEQREAVRPSYDTRSHNEASQTDSETADESATDSEAGEVQDRRRRLPFPRDAAQKLVPTEARAARCPSKRPFATLGVGRSKTVATTDRSTPNLAAALDDERSSAQNRKSEQAQARISRLRGQEKRMRPRADAAGQGGHRSERGVLAMATSRMQPPTALPSIEPVDLPAKESTTFHSSSNRTSASRPRLPRGIPIKKPNWPTYADCVASWTEWDKSGRLAATIGAASAAGSSSGSLAGTRLLLVGPWSKDLSRWVERVVMNGAKVVAAFDRSSSNASVEAKPTHVVSVDVRDRHDPAAVARALGVNSLAELRQRQQQQQGDQIGPLRYSVHIVTQAWLAESIAAGKMPDPDHARWALR